MFLIENLSALAADITGWGVRCHACQNLPKHSSWDFLWPTVARLSCPGAARCQQDPSSTSGDGKFREMQLACQISLGKIQANIFSNGAHCSNQIHIKLHFPLYFQLNAMHSQLLPLVGYYSVLAFSQTVTKISILSTMCSIIYLTNVYQKMLRYTYNRTPSKMQLHKEH